MHRAREPGTRFTPLCLEAKSARAMPFSLQCAGAKVTVRSRDDNSRDDNSRLVATAP